MIPYVQRARYLVIEANYDRELLDNGPYPLYLRNASPADADTWTTASRPRP